MLLFYGGELTINYQLTDEQIDNIVKEAVNDIGYTKKYQMLWGKENTICADDLIIQKYISKQSPDICKGVDNNGWGDQGIFWGMAVNNIKTDYLPLDRFLAQEICNQLYINHNIYGGIDIKTQVTIDDNNKIQQIVIAIPMLYKHSKQNIQNFLKYYLKDYQLTENFKLIINGTGSYVKHGPIADCGITRAQTCS